MDNHTPEQRRRNMQAVKNKNSGIERILKKALFRDGFRYRVNSSKVYGHPDIVFMTAKVAVFCDSEFWHGYDWEDRKADIKSNRDFWLPKIEKNIERDRDVTEHLANDGWLVLRFWGKQIKQEPEGIAQTIEKAVIDRTKSK